ncbi:MAG: hypothetical protein ACHP65_04820, partial [Legionellales bacterium]
MIHILFDSQRVDKSELEEHKGLIRSILEGSCHKVKKLAGWSHFQGNAVYRAKIDKEKRLIYTYVAHEGAQTALMVIGVMTDHNYAKFERQLSAPGASQTAAFALEPEPDAAVPVLAKSKDCQALTFLPTIPYKDRILILDASQQKALSRPTPLLLLGPPGAGKTALLYNIMLQNLDREPEAAASAQAASSASASRVLFVGPQHLLGQLKAHYQTTAQHPAATVEFATWNSLLELHHQGLRTEVHHGLFKQWLAEQKVAGDAKILHYEFSLIVALGAEKYLSLGQRQCYYSGATAQQQQFIALLGTWLAHLEQEHLFDPMVTALNTAAAQNYSAVYCDETQNLPPVALASLMKQVEGRHFIACLDSEQCLFSSPYVHNCLKVLFHQRYQSYTEHPLPKTWRCPPEIIAVANHLMDAKYALDGNSAQRRPYKATKSTLPAGGEIAWVDQEQLQHIKHYGALSGTVVIAEQLTEDERKLINQQLGSNNILTAADVIGLDFDTVILWEPFAQKRHFQQLATKNPATELSLEQWNALNAFYVAITRAQKNVFIHDRERKRFATLSARLFGVLPPLQVLLLEQPAAQLPEQKLQKERQGFQEQVSHHMSQGNISAARQIMSFHLRMSNKEIDAVINGNASSETAPPTAKVLDAKKASKPAAPPRPQAVPAKTAPATAADTSKKPSAAPSASNEQTKKTAAHSLAVSELKKYLLELSSENHARHRLFKERLQKNPDLAKEVSIDDLCCLRPDVLGEANTSALYCLAGSEDGYSILTILFETNLNLAAKISAVALCHPRPKTAGIWANDSALLRLAARYDDYHLLKLLLERNSALA